MNIRLLGSALCAFSFFAFFSVATPASASVATNVVSADFESFATGTVNGQDGWTVTGGYDQSVVDIDPVVYSHVGTQFGAKAFRISNAVASGGFGDQTFAQPLGDAVGETTSTAAGYATGTLQNHFEMQFDIASATTTEQPGLAVTLSPDRGDGSRMSYLKFTDTPTGIDVIFYDVQGTTNPANFVPTTIGTLSYTAPHTIKLAFDAIEGASNDLVKVYIDGSLAHVGTSWENYYRYDGEASAEQSQRVVKTVLFRVSASAPSTSGSGYLFDNVTLTSSIVPTPAAAYIVTPSTNTFGQAVTVDGTTYYSGISTYTTIQAAIDAAPAGSTISVTAGTYSEHLTVAKALTLQGANVGTSGTSTSRGSESIIDAAGIDAAIRIATSSVTIDGFTLKGGAGTYQAGVHSQSANTNVTIQNNIITDNVIGVYAECVTCTIENNLFDGNNRSGAAGGSAIYTEHSSHLTIRNNEFKNHLNNSAVIFAASATSSHVGTLFTGNYVHDNNSSNSMVYVVGMTDGTFSYNTIIQAGSNAISLANANTTITISGNRLINSGRGVKVVDDGNGVTPAVNSGIVVTENNLSGNSLAGIEIVSGYTGNLDATYNYWGAATGPYASTTNPSGTGSAALGEPALRFSPWYTTAEKTAMQSTLATSGTSTTVTQATTLTRSNASSTVTMTLPAGTTVQGPSTWDGTFEFPTATTTTSIPKELEGFWLTTSEVIEIGAGSVPLTFSQAVKLTFAGKAGQLAGWSQGGTFTRITATCNSATNPTLAAGADCKIDAGADLVVWTKHATTYSTFTQGSIPYGGGGGVSGGTSGVSPVVGQVLGAATTTVSTTTSQVSVPSITANTGMVLGVSVYGFPHSLGYGVRGVDVTELQKLLIAAGYLHLDYPPTQYFGPLTKAAVMKWQKAKNLPVTGFFGPMSRALLQKQSGL